MRSRDVAPLGGGFGAEIHPTHLQGTRDVRRKGPVFSGES